MLSRRTLNGLATVLFLVSSSASALAEEPVVVAKSGRTCNEDPYCINRLHPEIPMLVRAQPGQLIVLETRNAWDFELDPAKQWDDPRRNQAPGSTVHPLTGPVYIEGAKAGDVLRVRLLEIEPGSHGATMISGIGFVTDQIPGPYRILWKLDRDFAVTDDIPGVRIPNAGFPGIVTTLPGPRQLETILKREKALLDAGGAVSPPLPENASPEELCGPEGRRRDQCVRTIPPREHGGNMDIRYLKAGVSVYVPCYVDGCGLALGDAHYAQGDGEVSGTAIEMDSVISLRAEIVRGMELPRGPHYEGPSHLLDIPSSRFYAVTGFPFKQRGRTPPDMTYLDSPKVAPLANLSKDISLAARNALLEIVDYMVKNKGLTRRQAYLVASVAVDLRIGQLVDAPNVGVTAILPLDIFVDDKR